MRLEPFADTRSPSAIGRRARLDLELEVRRSRTVVAHAYAEPPFRVNVFDVADVAFVIIVCSGPGVFAGDRLQQSVRVAAGARAVLTSQTALQVHPGNGEAAEICHEYRVDCDAELHCHWDPVIPFAAASLSQRFVIDADASSRLYWSDAMMAGRLARGEAWQFTEVAHELRLLCGGALTYLERFRLAPRDRALTLPWVAGDAGYFATTIVRDPEVGADAAAELHQTLSPSSAHLAVDSPGEGVIVARLVATNGAKFASMRRAIRHTVVESIFRQPDPLARK